jgi:RNA polymerase sigma-70 factor (ECF subfamily)
MVTTLSGPALDDTELVRAAREGERGAFDALVRRHQDRVWRLCVRWLGDPETAREVAQDAFLAAYRAIGGFRGDASFRTWLLHIAVNHCRNAHTARRRRAWGRHDALGPDPTGRTLDMPDPGPLPDVRAVVTDGRQRLRAALAALDEDLRAVVLLRDVEDLDYEEIAQVLDVPRGTVKSRLHRARQMLAETLGEGGGT